MRGDRMIAILTLLQSHGKLSSRELARRLEVSERTVHRDLEALGAAGIPIYAERGARGGWMLPAGYRSGLTGMTAAEIRSLLLLQSSSVVRELGLSAESGAALAKLLAALPEKTRRDADIARQRIHVDGAGWRSGPPAAAPLLERVQEAVWEGRKLRIGYRKRREENGETRAIADAGNGKKPDGGAEPAAAGAAGADSAAAAGAAAAAAGADSAERWSANGGSPEDRVRKSAGTTKDGEASLRAQSVVSASGASEAPERIIAPLGLVAKQGAWYVVAGTDAGIRTFRVSRFESAELLDETFERPVEFDLPAWWEASTARFKAELPSYRAVVRIAETGWERFARERFVAIAERRQAEDGWIVAEADFNTLEHACAVLLGCGRHAEALSPPELRRAVRAEALAAAALYNPSVVEEDGWQASNDKR